MLLSVQAHGEVFVDRAHLRVSFRNLGCTEKNGCMKKRKDTGY